MKYDRAKYIEESLPIEKELGALFNTDKEVIIFEIGACEGEDTIKYARLFKKGKVYAFEPLADNIKIAHNNFTKYSVKNAEIFQKALSSQKGYAEFHVSQGQPDNIEQSDWDYGNKSSSLLAPEKHLEYTDFISFDKSIKVETDTIISFCQQNGINSIDFIHMDVQGAELLVLEGAGQFINNIKSVWLEVAEVELYKGQPLVNDVRVFMNKHNFVLVKNCINGFAGDQLYVSRLHFPNYKTLFPKGAWRDYLLSARILSKLKRLARKIIG